MKYKVWDKVRVNKYDSNISTWWNSEMKKMEWDILTIRYIGSMYHVEENSWIWSEYDLSPLEQFTKWEMVIDGGWDRVEFLYDLWEEDQDWDRYVTKYIDGNGNIVFDITNTILELSEPVEPQELSMQDIADKFWMRVEDIKIKK